MLLCQKYWHMIGLLEICRQRIQSQERGMIHHKPGTTTCSRCINLRTKHTNWDITISFPNDHHRCNKESKQNGTKDITLFNTNNTVKRLSDIINSKFNNKISMQDFQQTN